MSERVRIASSKIDVSVDDEVLNKWLLADDEKKLIALLTIRKKLESATTDKSYYFETAKKFLDDADNDCKWQAFIIVGDFMQAKPDECWQLMIEFGKSDDDDTRVAVATILLEHYFEENPHLFTLRFKELEQRIESGDLNLFKTLTYCRSGWGGQENYLTIKNFIEKEESGQYLNKS